jgi:hypothetical protein
MKTILHKIYGSLAFFALASMVACTGFDDFSSTPSASAVNLNLQLGVVNQDSIEVTVTNADTGYVSVALVEASQFTDYDPDALFAQRVAGLKYVLVNCGKNKAKSVLFTDLNTNTSYVVVAVAANRDGVLGTIQDVTTTTTDWTAPEWVSSSPAASINPVIDSTCAFTLTFDEPVVVDTSKGIQLWFMNDNKTVTASDLLISGSGTTQISIASKVPARNREVVFLSYGKATFADLVGNPAEALTSGLNGSSPYGLYWRVSLQLFAPTLMEPASGDSVVASDFKQIKLVYPQTVGAMHANYAPGNITVSYEDPDGSKLIKVVSSSSLSRTADSLFIPLPVVPVSGQTVSFLMKEASVKIGISNPNAAVSGVWYMK